MALRGQDVVGPGGGDRLRDVRLRAHGVDRHQTPRDIEQVQELGDRRDRVRMVLGLQRAQDQVIRTGPGTDELQRVPPARPIERPAQRLAVDRHALPLREPTEGAPPTEEARLERLGIQEGEDAPEGIARGNPVGQSQELLQPGLFGLANLGALHPRVRPADDPPERDHEDLQEVMAFGPLDARIFERSKMVRQVALVPVSFWHTALLRVSRFIVWASCSL